MAGSATTVVGGPYFEDFVLGQVFEDSPSLTLTPGHAAVHQAIIGDRMRLPLDAELAARVTGQSAVAHPMLVSNVAIGQSTGPSERVRGNLFYRGLVLLRQVAIGDTLHTRSEVVALKQNRPRPDGSATGLVAMRIRTVDQHDRTVLDFWRCPMIPMRPGAEPTGHADSLDTMPEQLDEDVVRAAVPDWRYELLRPLGERCFADLVAGDRYRVEARETVTCAPELARLTLNIARTHTDAGAGAHGTRLVYGGHTIAIAAAHATRAFPTMATIVAWQGCDHLAPVFEGDALATTLTITRVEPTPYAEAGLVWLRAEVTADHGDGEPPTAVLDWRFVAVVA